MSTSATTPFTDDVMEPSPAKAGTACAPKTPSRENDDDCPSRVILVHSDSLEGSWKEVCGVAAAIFASAFVIVVWRALKLFIRYARRAWGWDAIAFDLPLGTGAFMDIALGGLIVCMTVVAWPHLARLMRRPWDGWGETAEGLYWLGSAVCAWCFMTASNESLPLGIAYGLGLSTEDWGVALQISYIVLTVVTYVFIAAKTRGRLGAAPALGLCFAPVIALFSGFIFLAIGIAYVALFVLRAIGDALNRQDEEDDEWTDEDQGLLEDLYGKWQRTRGDNEACFDANGHMTANPFEASDMHSSEGPAAESEPTSEKTSESTSEQNEHADDTPAPDRKNEGDSQA